ncbi:MAG: acetyl-coenzyme A synthetase, partial [Acidiferrobacteraceae bacterium]|nr:acetyl-coenzyme A synthetase [Acidiferrobacteraceae bacterium]
MSDSTIHKVIPDLAETAYIDGARYEEMYQKSVSEPDVFWAEQAESFVDWFTPWHTVSKWNYHTGEIRWFDGATLNVAHNCIDRHLPTRGDQTAIIWEGDDPSVDEKLTYRELHEAVCRFANVLKARGVAKGDRVSIYMPMIPEAAIAMLSCARIGAVHSVVFGGFSPEALRDRILDSDCRVVITADEGPRGGKNVPLKANVEKALEGCPGVHTTIVVRRTGNDVPSGGGRDVWYHEAIATVSAECDAEPMDA